MEKGIFLIQKVIKMTTPISNVTPDDGPNSLQDQFELDLEAFEQDSLNAQAWADQLQADLAKLKAMIAEHKDPGYILYCFVPQMMSNWQSNSNASRLLLVDKSNLNTDIRNFESSALADLNNAGQSTPTDFANMISCLQFAAMDVLENPDAFGKSGTLLVDQINKFANQFSPNHNNAPLTIFDIDQFKTGPGSDYQYFMNQMTPTTNQMNPAFLETRMSSVGASTNSDPTPSSTPSSMFNAMSQNLANVNQDCTSVSAQLQVKLQYVSNILTNMLTMYKGVLKSDNDLLQTVNKIPST